MDPANCSTNGTFEQLVAEHRAAMLGYARRLTGDPHTAEDAVQEALIRAWRNIERLQPGDRPVRGWLLTVVRNIVIDRARARAARPAERCLPEQLGDASGPLNGLIGASHEQGVVDGALVQQLLRRLSPQHREALIHVYLMGLSTTEAAQAIGVATGTVKSRCFYALHALRDAIERGEVDLGDGRRLPVAA